MEDNNKSKSELLAEIQSLRDRLTASEDILRAIKQGEVDALVISTPQGPKIFTLQSADLSYRLLVEEMEQGAVVISTEGLILYCNKSFSNLLKQPLEKVIGSYFQFLISPQDTPLFQARVKQAERGERHPVEMFLNTRDGLEIPVYLSINHLILDDSPINCLVITDLTEQKRHEKTLASEKLARLILEQAGEVILVCDDTGKIIRASAIAQQLWGENLLFQPFDRLRLLYFFKPKFSLPISQEKILSAVDIDPNSPIKVPFSITPVLHGESYKGLEVEFERRDGQVLNLVLNARPLADQDNQFRGAVVILTNITQRKQAENALQAAKNELEVKVVERTQELQETNYRLQLELLERERREKILQDQAQLLDLAHDAILTVDLNDLITFWNHGAAALYGFSASEALGKNLAILLQTNFSKPLIEIKNELFDYGHWEGELIQQKQDGTLIVVASRWTVQRDLAGRPIEIMKINEDITERKQLEQDLAIREAWLNAFFTYSPVGMAILDDQLRFVQVNENAAQMSKIAIDKHIGKSLEELFPSWFPTLQPIYQQVLNTGQSLFNVEVEGDDPCNPGSIGYWLVSYHPIFNLTRQVIGVGYVAIDISDRKRAEESLRQYERIVSTTTDGIVLLNRNYIYQIANPAYLSWYNKSSHEILGHSIRDMIGQKWFEYLQPLVDRSLAGEIIQFEKAFDHLPGGVKFLSVTFTPYVGVERDISGVVVSLRDLTKLKEAEESLQQSELTLRSFFNSGAMLMGIVELHNGDILHISDNWAAAQFFGTTPETMQNQFASSLGVSPSTIRQWTAYYQQAEQNQAPVQFEYLHTNTDSQCWLSGSVSPIAVSPSGYSRFSYIVEDISDRKQAEQMLELQAVIARNMAEGICLVRADNGVVVYTNPKFEQMFGYDSGELNGQHVSIVNYACKPVIAEEVHQNIQTAVLQNREITYEVHNVKKDGTPFWCSATTSVFRHPEYGDVLVAVQQDISDRKQAEAELRELNLALENAVEGIARLDDRGRYISINRAYAENCGYQVSEMVGMEWPPTVHPEDRPKMLAAYQEMLTTGKVEVEAKGLRKDGSTFYKQLVMISAYNRQNNFVGHYCFMKDITERKKAEAELAAAKETAEAANRAKSEFLANMSHEIRTPMNAILGFSELLQGAIADPQPRAYLNSIAASGRTLLALINDILDFSKMEAGRLQLQYEPVDVRSLIREIQQILDPKAVKKGLYLLVEIDETVPTSILFDAVRLRQILFNTVGNALKFTEAGFVKISVRAQPEPSPLSNRVEMEITIADTGIGICFDQQESIFEAFKQSEGQSTRKYGGTGLGLAITKRLTEMLGGTVRLQSELGKGSAFTFIFPTLTITEIETRSVVPSKLDEDLNQFSTATVLVVDDVQFNLDLIAGYFADSKHRLLFAGDGQQAIEVAQTHYPDVILMDLWMPNMDGLQATKLLKQDERTKNIPIAIVTAISRPEDEATVRSLSQGFLRKPVSRSQLVSALKQILPQEANYFAVNEAPITPSKSDRIKPNPNALAKLPELVEKLRQEEESTWLELCKTMKRRDIRAFVERLQEWAHEYQCQSLLDYTTTLESQLATFDWELLPKTIEKFPQVRHQLL